MYFNQVSAWKRNLVRFLVVCVTAGLAVIFRDSFAYVGAFTGKHTQLDSIKDRLNCGFIQC